MSGLRGGHPGPVGVLADIDRIPVTAAAIQTVANPLNPPFRAGSVMVSCVWDVFVAVTSADGVTGLGYVSAFSAGNAELLAGAAQLLLADVGAAPRDLGELRGRMHAIRRADDVGVAALAETAYGAISMAVVDLAARADGVSVARMLGTPGEAAIYLSGGSLDAGPSELRALVQDGAGLGADIVKIKIDGCDESASATRVRAAASALGGTQLLAIDANQTFTPQSAAGFLAQLDTPEQIAWIEEPVAAADIAGLLWLRHRTRVRITAGESVFGAEPVRALVQSRAADRMILSIPRVGGVESFLTLGALAARLETPVASHVYPHLAVQLMPTGWRDPLVEYLPWWDRYFAPEAYRLSGGRLAVTGTAPGFGFSDELVRQLTGSEPR